MVVDKACVSGITNKNKLFGKVCIYSLHYTVLVFEAVLKQPDINKCH